MKLTVGVAASVLVAGIGAVGFAGPARAEGFGPGTYTITNASGESQGTWTVTPCPEAPTFIPCLSVAKTGGPTAPWNADAQFSVGFWSLRVVQPDLLTCEEGKTFPTEVTYGWDAGSLEGNLGLRDDGQCGGDRKSYSAPFKLVPA